MVETAGQIGWRARDVDEFAFGMLPHRDMRSEGIKERIPCQLHNIATLTKRDQNVLFWSDYQ